MRKIIFFVLLLSAFSAYAAQDSIQIKGTIISKTSVITNEAVFPKNKIETKTIHHSGNVLFRGMHWLSGCVFKIGYGSDCSHKYSMKIAHTLARTKKRRGQEKVFFIRRQHIILISPRDPMISSLYFKTKNCHGTVLSKKKRRDLGKFVYGFRTNRIRVYLPLVTEKQKIQNKLVFNLERERIRGVDNYTLTCSYE